MRLDGKKTIWASVAILGLSLSLLVGTAYGRMQGSSTAELIVSPSAGDCYSDCLVKGGQTVLLSDWDRTQTARTVTIATGEAPEVEDVTVELQSDYLSCTAAVSEKQIILTLTLQSLPAEATDVSFRVSWKGLSGTFQLTLAADAAAEAEPATEEILPCSGVLDAAAPLGAILLKSEVAPVLTLPEKMVRCSLDGGESYTLLYDVTAWRPTVPEGWNGLVLLDFSQTGLGTGSVSVDVAGQGTATFTFGSLSQTQPVFLTAAQLPYTITTETIWDDAEALVQVERLGADGYVADSQLTAAWAETGIALSGQPASGSYRLVIRWNWNQVSIAEQIIYIFVNTQ